MAPAKYEFGPLALASTSVAYTFTFTNTGGDPATGCTAPEKIGTHPGDFLLMNDTCGTMDLAGGASCTVQVAAKPTASGLRTMTLARTCATGGMATTTANGIAVNRPMYIFATDAQYTGNLGGLTGADLKCNTLGNVGSASSGKAQNWKAVLSTMSGTVVNAKDRFVWTGPMYNMNNEMVVVNPSVWPWTPVNAQSTILTIRTRSCRAPTRRPDPRSSAYPRRPTATGGRTGPTTSWPGRVRSASSARRPGSTPSIVSAARRTSRCIA